MIARAARLLGIVALAWTLGFAEGSGRLDAPSIRWDLDPDGRVTSVTVNGLRPNEANGSQTPWAEIFTVNLDAAEGPSRPSMLGTYRVEGARVLFTPRYPLDRGKRYRATFRPTRLPGGQEADVVSTHLVAKPARPATAVTLVSPSGDRLPENLLKFYLYFSSPMGRGEAYDHLTLLKADGKPVHRPFLELGEELWDPTQTRLTVLIDPGRIKRGLQPREQFGPVLEAGKSYSLVIDPSWRDAEGDPLGAAFRKSFQAGPPDETQPDPITWTIQPPSAATREPLKLTFPEPLDRALLESALKVLDAAGREVPGKIEIEAGQTGWRFTPEVSWVVGDYQLQVDVELEDLVGNSIRRPFEVDIQRDTPTRPEVRFVQLPIRIVMPKAPQVPR